jgi:hypothetical protein
VLLRNDHQFVDGAGRVDDSMAGPCFDIVTKYDNTSSRAWPNWGRAPNGCCALVLILLKSGQVFELIKMSWRWRMTSLNGVRLRIRKKSYAKLSSFKNEKNQ